MDGRDLERESTPFARTFRDPPSSISATVAVRRRTALDRGGGAEMAGTNVKEERKRKSQYSWAASQLG